MYNNHKWIVLISIALLMVACTGDDGVPWPDEEEYVPVKSYYPRAKNSFRIVSYNVGSFGKYMEDTSENIRLVGDLLKELDASVVALNELDSVNGRHMMNQVEVLAQEMGNWHWYFGRAISFRDGAYGNGVVVPNKESIIEEYTFPLPNSSTYESRSIAVVETERFVMAACHLDYHGGDYQLALIDAIIDWAEERYFHYHKPVFFAGDMNAVPSSEAIKTLEKDWEIISSDEFSIEGDDVKTPRCIDYIFHYRFSSPVKVVGAHTTTNFYAGDVSLASDHRPIYADIEFI